ncbi:flippase-like domain-containing protein, partial [Oligoflexia bacterium]|nr:flippase-like domain-containing protein [Oligoflexia bacterium]
MVSVGGYWAMVSSFFQSKAFKSALGVLISAGLILWIVFSVNWAEVGSQLYHMQYWALIPCSVLIVLHYILRAMRWRYLLPETEQVATRNLFDAIMIGNFASFILPLRAGEFIRPYMLTRTSSFRFSSCFISVVVERFFDLSVVLLSFGVLVFFVEGIPPWAYAGAWSLSFLALCIFVFMLVGSFIPDKLLSFVTFFLQVFPEKLRKALRKFIQDFLEGAAVLRKLSNL